MRSHNGILPHLIWLYFTLSEFCSYNTQYTRKHCESYRGVSKHCTPRLEQVLMSCTLRNTKVRSYKSSRLLINNNELNYYMSFNVSAFIIILNILDSWLI